MSGTALGLSLDPKWAGHSSGADLALEVPVSEPPMLAVRPQPIAITPCTDISYQTPVSISTPADYQGNHSCSTKTRNHGTQPFDPRKHAPKARALADQLRTVARAPKRGCTPSPRIPRTTCGSSGSGLRGPTMPKPSSVCTSLARRHSGVTQSQLAVPDQGAEADVPLRRRHDR